MIDSHSDALPDDYVSPNPEPLRRSATFLSGLRGIYRSYSLASWIMPFTDLATRSRPIQLAMRFFEAVRGTIIGDLMFMAFAALSALRCHIPRSAEGAVVVLALYPNERRAAGRFTGMIPNFRVEVVDVKAMNVLSNLLQTPRSIVVLIGSVFRMRSYLRRVQRDGHFLPLCQASKYIASYAVYEHVLRSIRPKAVVISTLTHPECWALVTAAHAHGIRSVFAAHASLPPDGNGVAPHTEFLLLYSEQCRESCIQAGNPSERYAFWGLDGPTQPLRFPAVADGELKIGLFLTAPVNEDALLQVIRTLMERNRPKSLLLRPHPIGFLSPDLSHLERDVPGLQLAGQRSLAECIAECHVVLAGNSNVHRDVLRAGVPTLYVDGIDLSGYDYWRFVRGGFVPEADPTIPLDMEALRMFYSDSWRAHFRKYDASFDEPPTLTQERVNRALTAFLNG